MKATKDKDEEWYYLCQLMEGVTLNRKVITILYPLSTVLLYR